ncbi:MAG: glycolate oxidase subunit GlcD [Deltaproteobacteria bacterium]|nr:MAG: glycolate oxidase subunit GlcD [Deltaproteobacteria bacterium]
MKGEIVEELKRIVGEEDVLTEKEDLASYAYDGTTNWYHEPDVVVFPTSAAEVSEILKLANRERIPVTPRGGGTSVSGGPVPIYGGIVLCTVKMNRILKIDKENLLAVAEPGVVLMDFNLALAKEGLFFPPDPQSFLGATLGGNVAENAGGPACVKYGVVKQYVLGLEAVLPTGEIVEFGGMTVKNVTGYDLPMLLTGSEGTLGVITKITLKVLPLPPATKTLMAVFDDVAVAGGTVYQVLSGGVIPSKIELLDNWVINSIERLQPMGLPKDAGALLLFEVDGIQEAVEKEAEEIERICREQGAREVRVAKDAEEANRYWTARRAGFAAVFSAAPTVLAEDVTVPRSKIPDFLRKMEEICKPRGIEYSVIGHAGDGNLHPSLLTDKKDPEKYAKAEEAMAEIIEAALELDGVLSGEHGIGLEKKKFLKKAMPPKAIELMKGIKRLLDPNNILNPGKIWEEDQ